MDYQNVDDEPPSLDYVTSNDVAESLEIKFPMIAYINLDRREDRKVACEERFSSLSLAVERLSAVDKEHVRNPRGHGGSGPYACQLSHRLVLRRARQRKVSAVLVFEDDVVFHPDFRRLAEVMDPPEDWGILLFGCTHVSPPKPVAPGWVRVKYFWGTQAYAVKRVWYPYVLAEMRKQPPRGQPGSPDNAISRMAGKIPIYAAYPNIAWQDKGYSDLVGEYRQAFMEDGRQNRMMNILRETNRQMRILINEQKDDRASSV